MEQQLDDVAANKAEWKELVLNFWKDFQKFIDEVMSKPNREVIDVINDELSPVIFNKKEDGMNTKCTSWTNCTHDGSGDLGIKVGKIGGFIGCSKYPDCKYTISIGNFIKEVNPNNNDDDIVTFPRILGIDADTNKEISIQLGLMATTYNSQRN